MTVQAHNPEQEEAEEEIEVSYEGNDREVGFNVNYLLDALARVMGRCGIGTTDSDSSCLIHRRARLGATSYADEALRHVTSPVQRTSAAAVGDLNLGPIYADQRSQRFRKD